MKCNKCGYDDGDSGDMAHVCQRPSYRYGEHPTSFGLVKPEQELKCNPHPKAPHGFNRNASHANDRYTCECEGWDAYDAGYQAGVMAGIEASMGQEPEQEPVACPECKRLEDELEHAKIKATVWKSAYDVEVGCNEQDTTPPQRKPLTDTERDSMVDSYDSGLMEKFWYLKGIDDTEAAHGIKGDA